MEWNTVHWSHAQPHLCTRWCIHITTQHNILSGSSGLRWAMPGNTYPPESLIRHLVLPGSSQQQKCCFECPAFLVNEVIAGSIDCTMEEKGGHNRADRMRWRFHCGIIFRWTGWANWKLGSIPPIPGSLAGPYFQCFRTDAMKVQWDIIVDST